MTAVEYILDGLEAELALERELGVRAVEFDRALLATEPPPAPNVPPRPATAVPPPFSRPAPQPMARPEPQRQSREAQAGAILDFAFIHDRPLSPEGGEMMAKIVAALHRTAETAPVVTAPPLPKAKVYIVLGGLAQKKHFPKLKGSPGQWLKAETGEDVLVTYSPEYILRFGKVTPTVEAIKKSMWRSIKSVLQRI